MKIKNCLYTFFFVVFFLFNFNLQAALSPIAFSLFPPLQLPTQDFSVALARISVLWGAHRDVYGLDIGGIGNRTEQSFVGSAVAGLFNYNQGSSTVIGVQLAGATNININKATIIGLQATLGLNYNQAESTAVGLQIGAIGNYSPFTQVYGMQVGLYNHAKTVYGLQLGLINIADSLHGVQIGLMNFNMTGFFSAAPILNIGF